MHNLLANNAALVEAGVEAAAAAAVEQQRDRYQQIYTTYNAPESENARGSGGMVRP